jgi:signal transduction histidine kinase
MANSRFHLTRPAWLRAPRRTARIRLTALYGGLFLISGAALVSATYLLFERATAFTKPALPQIPRAPSLQDLLNLPLPQAFAAVANDQSQVVRIENLLGQPAGAGPPSSTSPPLDVSGPVASLQARLAQDQHQLAQATNHLAHAVHQFAQAGSIQASQRAADSHELLVNSAIALGIVVVLAVLAGWLVSGRMLRPIRTITHTARRISSTSLHERLALDGPQDELKELGDTLDGLFARLEGAFDAQRHFVANASHELRTPLTAERNLLQVALDDPDTTNAEWRSTAEEVLASNDEQAHLIDSLLTLTSSEGGLSERAPVDLAPIVEEALAGLQSEITHLQIHVEDTKAPAPLEGDSLLVERLVVNLLTNAVRHNAVGGKLRVMTGVTEARAFLSVTNSGPVIPAAEVERLFQPFERLDPRRVVSNDGHGLGLSIVRAIASAHGASITADPGPEGGLSIRVSFHPRTSSGRSPEPNEPTAETELAANSHGNLLHIARGGRRRSRKPH